MPRPRRQGLSEPVEPIVQPPVPPPVEECSTCKYYQPKAYLCRRYPPSTSTVYPIRPSDWCGEYMNLI